MFNLYEIAKKFFRQLIHHHREVVADHRNSRLRV